MIYFLSCEGETERWYFEWLKNQINNDSRTKNKVDIKFKKLMPSAFAKSNAGTFTKDMLNDSIFCRIQDIEDYNDEHIKIEVLICMHESNATYAEATNIG